MGQIDVKIINTHWKHIYVFLRIRDDTGNLRGSSNVDNKNNKIVKWNSNLSESKTKLALTSAVLAVTATRGQGFLAMA